MTPPPTRRASRTRRAIAAIALLVLVVVLGAMVQASQSSSRDALRDRFATRNSIAARFVGTYLQQTLEREVTLATQELTGTDPGARFVSLVAAFGFQAAVLLDSEGRVISTLPDDPALRGQPIAAAYTHLSAALHGQATVSDVVPSAARGVPVVGLAVPFDSPTGRRVFSGAYGVAETPLGAFLRDANPISGAIIYLVDGTGTVVARGDVANETVVRLDEVDARLAEAVAGGDVGAYRGADGVDTTFATSDVRGTGWRTVSTAPSAALYGPVSGAGAMVPWALLAILALFAAALWEYAIRYVEGRDRLIVMHEDLLRVSREDGLTGLHNRRHLDERLAIALASASRRGRSVAVLMIDIDHFKRVNDTFGHDAGDRVLRQVADALSAEMRIEDVLGRWGGEEFMAVMPETDLDGALLIAERLRLAIATRTFGMGPGREDIEVTTSIGCSTTMIAGGAAMVVGRADRALYEAKAAGRNRVVAAPDRRPAAPSDPAADLSATSSSRS